MGPTAGDQSARARGPRAGVRPASPRRMPAGSWSISSTSGSPRRPRATSATPVSKLALAAATELLATALAPRVRVNGIAPGPHPDERRPDRGGFRAPDPPHPARQGQLARGDRPSAGLLPGGRCGHRRDSVRGRRPAAGGARPRRSGDGQEQPPIPGPSERGGSSEQGGSDACREAPLGCETPATSGSPWRT